MVYLICFFSFLFSIGDREEDNYILKLEKTIDQLDGWLYHDGNWTNNTKLKLPLITV